MATAIYGGLLLETKGFTNSEVNGTIFAMAKELIECGANHKICSDWILKSTTLSALRLKSIMLKNMVLLNNAKAAVFFISNNEIKLSGSVCEDWEENLIESLKLPYVELAVLLDTDNEYEVLKLIYKEV
jgi:phosphoesterase RecJ-like protein